MNPQIKKKLDILAYKFKYEVEFQKHELILKNNFNSIKIKDSIRNSFLITYNLLSKDLTIEINITDIYDVLLEIIHREYKCNKMPVKLKNSSLITWKLFLEHEGDEKYWFEVLKKKKLNKSNILYELIGGNRIILEYCDRFLLLYDDINYYKSNIYEFEEIISLDK